jgi:hypothetical protein
MSHKIYVRSDPWRAVVKPYPKGVGFVNLMPAQTREDAQEHAAKLNARHGWQVVDETA